MKNNIILFIIIVLIICIGIGIYFYFNNLNNLYNLPSYEESTYSMEDLEIDKEEIKEIPVAYKQTASKQGKVVRKEYKSGNLSKFAYVYLPYGYDENDKETKYNVFYLLHGGGGSQNSIFSGENTNSTMKNILDNMIENNELEPLIVIAPTYYDRTSSDSSVSGSDTATAKFHTEVINDLVPAIEMSYNTYLEENTKEGIEKSREHRAYGGFSMGSVSTWYEFIYDLDYFKYYMPMSGDCWIKGQMGGSSYPKETAEYLNDVVSNSKYKNTDFYIYALTGSDDIAYNTESSQIMAMKEYANNFIYNKDKTKGNFYFSVLDGGVHTYEYVLQYVYNALPTFWTR